MTKKKELWYLYLFNQCTKIVWNTLVAWERQYPGHYLWDSKTCPNIEVQNYTCQVYIFFVIKSVGARMDGSQHRRKAPLSLSATWDSYLLLFYDDSQIFELKRKRRGCHITPPDPPWVPCYPLWALLGYWCSPLVSAMVTFQ